jgi:hypothetical protein
MSKRVVRFAVLAVLVIAGGVVARAGSWTWWRRRSSESTRARAASNCGINKAGTTYYLNGNTWFQPSFGANGVYYRVVPTP